MHSFNIIASATNTQQQAALPNQGNLDNKEQQLAGSKAAAAQQMLLRGLRNALPFICQT